MIKKQDKKMRSFFWHFTYWFTHWETYIMDLKFLQTRSHNLVSLLTFQSHRKCLNVFYVYFFFFTPLFANIDDDDDVMCVNNINWRLRMIMKRRQQWETEKNQSSDTRKSIQLARVHKKLRKATWTCIEYVWCDANKLDIHNYRNLEICEVVCCTYVFHYVWKSHVIETILMQFCWLNFRNCKKVDKTILFEYLGWNRNNVSLF